MNKCVDCGKYTCNTKHPIINGILCDKCLSDMIHENSESIY